MCVIENTTTEDLDFIYWLFDAAINYQKANGYPAWRGYDKNVLQQEIGKKLQFKIVSGQDILCIFSINLSDPFTWQEREKGDAVYLHRIVTNPNFKGQKLFEKVLKWTKEFAIKKNLAYIRMDTWPNNISLINYYKSFGFEIVAYTTTPDTEELPEQNRNLDVVLMQLSLC